MIKFYVGMIKRGKMKLENVPRKWREVVRLELIKEGFLTENVEENNGDEGEE